MNAQQQAAMSKPHLMPSRAPQPSQRSPSRPTQHSCSSKSLLQVRLWQLRQPLQMLLPACSSPLLLQSSSLQRPWMWMLHPPQLLSPHRGSTSSRSLLPAQPRVLLRHSLRSRGLGLLQLQLAAPQQQCRHRPWLVCSSSSRRQRLVVQQEFQ